MQRIVRYKCEICGGEYRNIDDAANCEARGPGIEYPIGCVYGDHRPGAFYENITFAVAQNRVRTGTMFGHFNDGSSWACRDNGARDSLGRDRCCGNSLRLTKNSSHLDPSAPHFLRMVKWLTEQNIDITVWDGEKPISYAEFLENFMKGDKNDNGT